MRAVEISAWSTPQDLRVSDIAPPPCGPEEVRIRVAAAPVSYALSLLIAGKYQRKPQFPFVPGNTAAGTVIETGSQARRFRPGDRVLASMELGGLAEEAVAHEANVYALPASLPFSRAIAFNTAYNSVAAALTWPHLLDIKPDQWLLVHGGAGGVGSAAIEIARHLGATIIATASTEAKRAFAIARGAHHAIDADPETLRDRVMDIVGKPGVHRVLDPVGGRMFMESLRCLRPEGRILPIGFAGGEIPQIPANLLVVKNITVCGLYMGYYKIDERKRFEPQMRALFDQLGRWFEDGAINPVVSAEFPLDQVPQAFARVLDRGNIGHVAVTMGGDTTP
jgi:NADPH2:quinone reductase